MNVRCLEPSYTASSRIWSRACSLLAAALPIACGNSAALTGPEPASTLRADAPLVNAEPGAWFDARGNLTIVGAGKRLRLVLSAPIEACRSGSEQGGSDAERVTNASLPYHVLSEACRSAHPTVLLPEEGETASPSELERSYHEVARCTASELGLSDGWIPELVAKSDPCPLALGLGWRLPSRDELLGLTLDDRKAVAGALFDAEDRNPRGSLLLFARAPSADLTLVTLSPNAAERPPSLDDTQRDKPLFGVALRCVNDNGPASLKATPPVLPHAAACLREARSANARLTAAPSANSAPEVQKLKRWLEGAERAPSSVTERDQLQRLLELLSAPALDGIAREARDERVLTERYAELAEGLDDQAVSQAERERRRAEFENLRRRLGGQIVSSAETGGRDRTTLPAVLSRLAVLLEAASAASAKSKPHKKPPLDYTPLLTRLRSLRGAAGP